LCLLRIVHKQFQFLAYPPFFNTYEAHKGSCELLAPAWSRIA
jgi:hypothetical protein